MRHRPLMTLAAVTLAVALSLSGCARGGEQQPPIVPEVVLEIMVRFAGPVNDLFYYFIALDADGDFGADGPLPVAAGPRWGNGWGTGSMTHFVEYHQGRYELFRADLTPVLVEQGGGIRAVEGIPDTTDAGEHAITVDSLDLGAATVTADGAIATVTNDSFQAAGTIALETNSAGETVAGSVGWTPAAQGGRDLTADEQAALDVLNAGGVAVAADSLAALGLTLTLAAGPDLAGTQQIEVAQTVAQVTDQFTPAGGGAAQTSQGTLPANNDAPPADGLIPGMTIRTDDLVVGETARIDLEPAVTATSLGVPYDSTLPEGGTALYVTLDLEQLGANLSDLSLNFIATTELIFDPTVVNADENVYDALGRFGNDYFTIPTNQYQTISNDDAFITEQADDPTLEGPGTDADKRSVDIVDWRLTLRRLR